MNNRLVKTAVNIRNTERLDNKGVLLQFERTTKTEYITLCKLLMI